MEQVDGFLALADVIDREDAQRSGSAIATVVRTDAEGTVWVHYDGGVGETPIHDCQYSVKPGDSVAVRTKRGRSYIEGNSSDVPASSSTAKAIGESAIKAMSDAATAFAAASSAISSANTASAAASAAQTSADQAATAAAVADGKAVAAGQAAASAQGSADAAAAAASAADGKAVAAASAASAAQSSADAASAAASVADGKAVAAGNAAAAAQADATRANTYSTAALDQLGIVQDVIGVLDYAAKHGAFSQTSDTEIEEGKVYFTRDSQTGDYVPVVNPQASALSTYWEMDYDDDKMGDFIMAHLAVTSRGLWVLPSGVGSSTTPASGETQADSDARQGSGYKMLLASGGSYIYDAQGVLVRSDTADGTRFASGKDWHVGGQNAYIFYDASEGTINIGGSNIQLGGTKTLSELMDEVDNTMYLEVEEEYNQARTQVTCTAHLYQGGTDIARSYPASDYAWYLKSEGGSYPLVAKGDGYSITVSLADAGYGAAVKCVFEPHNDAVLLDSDDDTLTDSDDTPLAVRTPSGDYVRVADLTVETTVFDTDKVMVVGSEDEHLVTIGTLKDVFGDGDYERLDNMPSIEDVTLSGNKTFPDLGIFKTDAQGYSVADQYTLTTLDINSLWANAQPIGG